MEKKKKQPEQKPTDPILRFVLDGVYYSLTQNEYVDERKVILEAKLQDWFPGIHFVIKEDEIRYFETGEA